MPKQPEQLSAQKMEALMLGNKIRVTRAADKRRIKTGELDPAEVLRRPPTYWEKASILELLTAMKQVGKKRARKWLWAERIDPVVEIGQMPEIQRYRLAKHLEAAVRRAGEATAG